MTHNFGFRPTETEDSARFEVFAGSVSHGCYDTLSEALCCVEFDRLVHFDIYEGDNIIESSGGSIWTLSLRLPSS